jgi:mediator of RNA polymerase II transcription subunit 31
MADTTQPPPPPTLSNPRFTLELEFVLSLANPHYLSHLAITYPNLLGTTASSSTATTNGDSDNNTSAASAAASSEAQAFAAYLAYLYSYWKTPEYAQFLTHPGATLRALRLLQEETFRKDVIRPQVIEGLLGIGLGTDSGAAEGTGAGVEGEAEVKGEQGGKAEG